MNHCESCRYGGNCDKEWRYSKLTYPCEKYDKVQTNEEWIKSMNTEQLAEFLADKCNEVKDEVLYAVWETNNNIDDDEIYYRQSDFVDWLKEVHHE